MNNTNNTIDYEFEQKIKQRHRKNVAKAIEKRQIFQIHSSWSMVQLKCSLKKRGWIEKSTKPWWHSKFDNDHKPLLRIYSKLLDGVPPNFIWQYTNKKLQDQYDESEPFRNKLRINSLRNFTDKLGLIACAESDHWNQIDDTSAFNVPRSYRMNHADDRFRFVDDYRITACLSLLRFIGEQKKPNMLFSMDGKVPMKHIFFAISRISEMIAFKMHEDVDKVNNPKRVHPWMWSEFFAFYNVVVRGACNYSFHSINYKNVPPKTVPAEQFGQDRQFECDSYERCLDCLKKCSEVLDRVKVLWPNKTSDGILNTWILKPNDGCCGSGIKLFNEYNSIMNHVNRNKSQNIVVQKYIERPLLMKKRKFHIRQFFLIAPIINQETNNFIINVWMYKDCYLLHSSLPYSLNTFDGFVHLTNYSIQSERLDASEKTKSYWSLRQFKAHLRSLDRLILWSTKIYPTMKRNIVAAVQQVQYGIDLKKNCFELYGCDFMITDTFDIFLLEINSNPGIDKEFRCDVQIQEDVVKVVIDRSKDPNARTGKFELIYSIEIPTPPLNVRNIEKFKVRGIHLDKNVQSRVRV